jgi:hypothetical protein
MADDSNSPATKADLAQLKTEMRAEMRADMRADMTVLEDRLTEKMTGFQDQLTENMRDMETRLLNAFYGYAASDQKRTGELERESAGIKDRLAILELRVTEVEKRLNTPPAA